MRKSKEKKKLGELWNQEARLGTGNVRKDSPGRGDFLMLCDGSCALIKYPEFVENRK